MLYDCYNSQQSSFSPTAECFKKDFTNETVLRSDGTPYNNNIVNSPYNVLNSIPNPDNLPLQPISFNELFDSAGNEANGQSAAGYQHILDLNNALSSKQFNDELETQYKSVRSLRSDLDNKMRDIYNPEVQDEYITHEQSVYITLSWTIVATSVLYYLFVKL
jgi:hypothetical protein